MDHPAGTVYVTNIGDGTVSVIHAATGAVSAPITVSDGPTRWRSPHGRNRLRDRHPETTRYR